MAISQSTNEDAQATNRRKAPLVLAALALAALVFVLASVGQFRPLPLPGTTTIESSCSEDFGNAVGAITDQSGERLVTLDGDGRVLSETKTSQVDEDPVYYDEVEVEGDYVYVCEYTYYDDTDYLSSARIAKYDKWGNRLATLAQYNFNLDELRTMTTIVLDLEIVNDEGVALVGGLHKGHLGLLRFPLSGETETLGKDTQDLGTLPGDTTPLAGRYFPDTGKVVSIGLFGRVYEKSADDSAFRKVDTSSEELDETVTQLVNQLESYDFAVTASEGETFGYAPEVMVLSILYWACVAYLALVILALVIVALRRTIQANDFHTLKIALLIVLGLGGTCGIVSFYSYNITAMEQNHAEETLVGYSSTLSTALNDELANAISVYQDDVSDGNPDEDSSTQTLMSLSERLEEEASKTALAGNGVDFSLIVQGPEGEAKIVADSAFYVEVGSTIARDSDDVVAFSELSGAGALVSIKNPYTNSLYAASPVYDADGKVVGVLTAGKEITPLNATTLSNDIALFLTLVDALIIAAFIVTECANLARSLRSRRLSRHREQDSGEIAKVVARPLAFLAIGSHACVTTLLTLIAQDALSGTALADNGLVIAIPATAAGLGMLAGVTMQAFLARHLPLRRLVIVSALLLTAMFVIGGIGVSAGNFIVLTVAVFLGSVFDEAIATSAFKLPLSLSDDADRSALNRSLSAGLLSSAALAGIFTGALTQYYGNQFSFFLGAAYALVIVPLVLVLIPKNFQIAGNDDSGQDQKVKKKHIGLSAFGKFLSDPPMLAMIACVVIPVAIVGGYKSYLFPLLAGDAGMTKSTIASIIVYCNAFAYFTSPLMAKAEAGTGPRTLLIGACSLLAVIFLVLAVNTTMTWIIAALVIVTLAIKVIEPGYASFWQNRIVRTGASKDAAYTAVKYLERAGEILRAPALGSLATLCGISLACPVVGIALAVCVAIFALASRKATDESNPRDQN